MDTCNKEDNYECFTCNRLFSGRVFEISREWNRTDFSKEIPEVEIQDAWGLECYCSTICLVARRGILMALEGVPIHPADIGPVERCAKCGGPVEMDQFHLAYVETSTDVQGWIGYTVDVDYLAVVCNTCMPRVAANKVPADLSRSDENEQEELAGGVASSIELHEAN
jgi:hypothetical protein